MQPLMVKPMSHSQKACNQEACLAEMKRHSAGQRSQKKAVMMRSIHNDGLVDLVFIGMVSVKSGVEIMEDGHIGWVGSGGRVILVI